MNLIALKNTTNLMKYNQFYLFNIVLEDLLSVFYFVQSGMILFDECVLCE